MRVTTILSQILASSTLASLSVGCGGRSFESSTSGAGPANVEPDATSQDAGPLSVDASVPRDARVADVIPDAPVDVWRPRDTGLDVLPGDGSACEPELVRALMCEDVWLQPCGTPPGVNPQDGMDENECALVCGAPEAGSYFTCSPYILSDLPGPSFTCYNCAFGRRPQGFGEPEAPNSREAWFRSVVSLEHASIEAFQILARELRELGAPEDLIQAARIAEKDEVRHTRTMALLGRLPVPLKAARAPLPCRPLLDIAVENAVEGCVRETVGALVAGYQARHAMSRPMRTVMTRIAADEGAHAELAWNVHTWMMARLSPAERTLVFAEMRKAKDALVRDAEASSYQPFAKKFGLPHPRAMQELLRELDRQLFVPALAA